MSPTAIALFVAGLVLLLIGAELLVRGASRLAVTFGISPLVIGLTVVAWGTGSPELAVAVKAALAGPVWKPLAKNLLMVAIGLYVLVVGSDWLVDGAAAIAVALGFSELIIGLTIVALGTSLPELATSAIASARGERDIAVGNAVGSNIFNLLAVLGITAFVAPGGIPVAGAALRTDIPIMIAVAVACLPVFFAGYVIHRWNGALFVALYAAYVVHLVLQGTQHAAGAGFNGIMLVLVLPLVALLLVATAWRGRLYSQRS